MKKGSGVRRRAYVLLVDDNDALRSAVHRMLECTGYRVKEAADGEEALAICQFDLPDLIVLDGDMPRMDGPTFTGTLSRALGPHLPPIIVLSGDVLVEGEVPWPGVVKAFPKPPPIDRFLRAIHEQLGRLPSTAATG